MSVPAYEKSEGSSPEKPVEPFKFYRKLTAGEEAMIEQHLKKHPGLTREKVLKEMQSRGF